MLDWQSHGAEELLRRVSPADIVVVASPTFKGTYSGLLKLFFDRVPSSGLRGVTAIPVMLIATLRHAHAVDVHLRITARGRSGVPVGGWRCWRTS